ncbi:KAP family P-loop domain protein [Gimesia panareensis]|uniref:KAP family P-loop domain protein n=1 Tax=Gimesia panareensis TaxID=2527978 RepID=A0A517QAP1_9PLAN|nr:P-loop NTPase fold protein [Gimesia panareensis]QDT28645.1 KAP family P-loop domain protein [Gimesia panareensis]
MVLKAASLIDSPIKSNSDDFFEFDYLVSLLSARIDQCEKSLSDTVALYGPWGSGKSSILALTQHKSKSRHHWFLFDALRYQSHGDIIVPLLHFIASQAAPAHKLGFKKLSELLLNAARKYVSERLPETKIIFEGARQIDQAMNVKNGLPESYAVQVEHCFRQLISLILDQGQGRVVIAIDNLDRCRPDAVLLIIETLHLVLNVPGVTFIVAVDQDAIIRFINGRYLGNGTEAALYLEKIFPDYYRVPTPWSYDEWSQDQDPISRYLSGLTKNTEAKKIRKYVRTMWAIISYSQALKNPRRIKRIVRRLSLLKSPRWGENSAKFVGFFFLVALSDIWPHAYRAFYYAEPDEWESFIEWIVLDYDFQKAHKKSNITITERKLRLLAEDESLVEFIVATTQCFSSSEDFDIQAFNQSIIKNYNALWNLLDHVAQIGL